jgi:serine/threonine protein kinase
MVTLDLDAFIRWHTSRPVRNPVVSGAGGMGEVYKARDTWLDRAVAVKILPDSLPPIRSSATGLTAKPARSQSSITPHICALYDVGEQDARRISSCSTWKARRWRAG